MPFADFVTNIAEADLPGNFHQQLAETVAAMLGKPPDRVVVSVRGGATMWRGGETPAVTMNIYSFNVFTPEKNINYSKTLHDFVTTKLGVPSDRFLTIFHDVKPEFVAYKGTTAAELFK